jgi:hypothetical protein
MDERTKLINQQSYSLNNSQSNIFNDGTKRKHVTFILPSLENEATHRDRFFSIRLCYICMFLSSVSFTICMSSMWPFLQIVSNFHMTS